MHSIFYILLFAFSTLFFFASNLHILSLLLIDTHKVLDIPRSDTRRTTPSLHAPLYALSLIGAAWTAVGYALWTALDGAQGKWRGVPALTGLVVVLAAVAPMNVLYRKERRMFTRSLRRIIFSPLYSAVPFCDVIFADILTSSSKVLGDLWVSTCMIFLGEEASTTGCAREWMVPIMISLPYIFRFRQCLSEVLTGNTPTPKRSLMNAAKYATAFPVIIFSAMQTVVGDPFDLVDPALDETRWIGRDTLFRLWIFSVLVNTLYSFWWDVTNDWGLSLLTFEGWRQGSNGGRNSLRSSRINGGGGGYELVGGAGGGSLVVPGAGGGAEYPPTSPSPSKVPAASHRPSHSRAFSTSLTPNTTYPFLRPVLLLPDPTIYYLAIILDLLLRFSWSVKLSSHLHSIQEIEGGIVLMEGMEVVRRWMWVYLRMEWEAVRKGGGGGGAEEEGLLGRRREDGEEDDEENIGLGILVRDDGGKH